MRTLGRYSGWWGGEYRYDVPELAPAWLGPEKKTVIATEQDPGARAQWRTETDRIDARSIIFLDETSTQTVMTRARGRAPRGRRVVGRVPRNHGPNITCLAALTPTGIAAPLVFRGALDGIVFETWVREALVPVLRPGTTVILDNLSVHKNAAARAAIEAAGCTLRFLPAYSPDFNPIEPGFSKLKTYLRGASARDYETLSTAIGAGLTRITAADAAAYYRHCGYDLQPPQLSQPLCNPL